GRGEIRNLEAWIAKREKLEEEEEERFQEWDEEGKSDDSQDELDESWAECDVCGKWRRVMSEVALSLSSGTSWRCDMNEDSARASCDVPEEEWEGDDDDWVWNSNGQDTAAHTNSISASPLISSLILAEGPGEGGTVDVDVDNMAVDEDVAAPLVRGGDRGSEGDVSGEEVSRDKGKEVQRDETGTNGLGFGFGRGVGGGNTVTRADTNMETRDRGQGVRGDSRSRSSNLCNLETGGHLPSVLRSAFDGLFHRTRDRSTENTDKKCDGTDVIALEAVQPSWSTMSFTGPTAVRMEGKEEDTPAASSRGVINGGGGGGQGMLEIMKHHRPYPNSPPSPISRISETGAPGFGLGLIFTPPNLLPPCVPSTPPPMVPPFPSRASGQPTPLPTSPFQKTKSRKKDCAATLQDHFVSPSEKMVLG
ncbi:unnamed protein product, partial [Discosporangium mesarthrocarpum]